MFNALDEELCVYQMGVLLMQLTAGIASTPQIPSDFGYLEYQYLASEINATTGKVDIATTGRFWSDVMRSTAWTPEALAFLQYVTRYDEARGGLGAAPGTTTMAGLRAVLMPAVDVIDLTMSDDEMDDY
jgi:hypothetical protein